jgi:hypothetical protein
VVPWLDHEAEAERCDVLLVHVAGAGDDVGDGRGDDRIVTMGQPHPLGNDIARL